jgi:hypothetical protein
MGNSNKNRDIRSKRDPKRKREFIKKEYLILFAIFLFALFIRVYSDPNIPYHYDPGKNIVYAHAALDSFPLVPQVNAYFNLGEYYEYQVLYPYTLAFLYKISGISLVVLAEWLVVFTGAALCLTTFFLSREIFGNTTAALVTAFLVAVSKIQILGYMNYYPQIMAMTLMPLAALFLIRFIKTNRFGYLLLVAILSVLIVLASYLTALVYFLIALIALALWSFREKKAVHAFFLIPLMTIVLLAFFWLPIVWRHGIQTFIQIAVSDILTPQISAFTNQTWTLMDFLTYSSATIIAIVLGICALLFIKRVPWKWEWDFSKVILTIWLSVSFVLISSYLFFPILWVDRYFQFFDIALLIVAGFVIAIIIAKLNAMKWPVCRYKGYLILLLLIIPLYGAVHLDTTFGRWGYPSDIAMGEYMQKLPANALVVAPPSVQGFWFSATSGIHILGGGDSSQMIGSHYLGDLDSATIINSPDITQKMSLIRKYGVNYIVIPYHADYPMMWNADLNPEGIAAFNNSAYFTVDQYFTDTAGSTVLLKVRENLTPGYQANPIDWGVTVAGYIISLIGLCGFCTFWYLQRKTDNVE